MAFLDDVMVEQISAEARQLQPGRTILTILAAVFFGIGLAVEWVFGGLWLALTWSAVAMRAGWREGRKRREQSGLRPRRAPTG